MRLVFITRKVDRGDPLTGFVFGWLNKLASQLDYLYVVCQEKGEVTGLFSNIEVYSFGKEKGYGRLRQGYELFMTSCKLARKVDGFFVHMHPVYAIVASMPAKLFRRKIILWYTHKAVDLKLRVALALVDRVLTASKESFRLRSRKVRVVGHGIDLFKFRPLPLPLPRPGEGGRRPGEVEHKFRIISIGRISPVKDYETLIKAAEILKDKGAKDFAINVYGRVGLPEHQTYLDALLEFVKNAELEDWLKFPGELSYDQVNQIYQDADLAVNLSQTGSIDKSVLEAAASGVIVISSNEAFAEILSGISPLLVFQKKNPVDLAEKIQKLRNLNLQERAELQSALRVWVETEHNLENLVKLIAGEFS